MFWARKIYSKATTVTWKEPAKDAQDKLNAVSRLTISPQANHLFLFLVYSDIELLFSHRTLLYIYVKVAF